MFLDGSLREMGVDMDLPPGQPQPFDHIFCDDCGKLVLKTEGKNKKEGKSRNNIGTTVNKHKKDCNVNREQVRAIRVRIDVVMEEIDESMLGCDPDGFAIASSEEYSKSTLSTAIKNPCLPLPYCDFTILLDIPLALAIDDLLGEELGRFDIADMTIRYLASHQPSFKRIGNNTLLPKILSFLMDRYIPDQRCYVTYSWWLRKTVRFRSLNEDELAEFISAEEAKGKRLTVEDEPKDAPLDQLDLIVWDRCEVVVASLFGGTQEEVQKFLLEGKGDAALRSPVALALRFFYIEYSGRHNHTEDDNGIQFDRLIPRWREFVRSRMESRKVQDVAREVFETIKRLHSSGTDMKNILNNDQFERFKTDVLAATPNLPPASVYPPVNIRAELRLLVDSWKADLARSRVGLTYTHHGDRWNEDIDCHFALALFIMKTNVASFRASKLDLHTKCLEHLRSTRLGKTFTRPNLESYLKGNEKKIDGWIEQLSKDDALYRSVKEKELERIRALQGGI